MTLQKELKSLKSLAGTDAFNAQLKYIKSNFNSAAEQKKINDFALNFAEEALQNANSLIEQTNIRLQLAKVDRLLPLSYIAETYFKKSKHWLYQRINGNYVNGKPAQFTKDEVRIFNKALKDIGKEISSFSISL